MACLTAITGGDVSAITLHHWKVALITGGLAGIVAVARSLTRLFRHYRPWRSFALMSFLSTFFADRLSHAAPLGPPWSEALTTACGAAVVSALISLASFAAAVERLENPDFHP